MRAINLSAPAGNATPLIVRALLDASEGDTIRLNGGVWHFYEDGACERYAAPSNNANGIKKIIFPLIDKRNVAVDGGGATLLFHDRVFPFVVSGCEDVRVENVTIDFSFPRYAVATALESDERGFSLRVDEARFPWFVQDGCWAFRAGSALRTTAEKKFFLAGGMKNRVCCYLAAGDTRDPLFNLAAPLVRADARRTEANVVRLDYRENSARVELDTGAQMIVSNDENRENDVFFIENSAGVTARSVTILRGAGMGFIGQMSHDILLENISVHPVPERGEPYSITADIFHFVNCDGALVIRGCDVSDSLDDAVNVHGVYTRVQTAGEDKLMLRLGHQEQYGLNPYRRGDRVRVTKGDGSDVRGYFTVTECVLCSDDQTLAMSYENADCAIEPGDYIDNPGRAPELLIEDCRFERCPRVLLGSSRKTIARRNHFALNGAVAVIDGMAYWYEAGLATDVRIEDNTFDHSGLKDVAAITVILRTETETRRAHKNIRIANNRVTGAKALLDASHAEGLTIENNMLEDTAGEIRLRGCGNVRIDA